MKVMAGLAGVMVLAFVVAVLAAVDVIDLPGHWRTTLGLAEETPNPPCRLGLYRQSPATPAPPAGRRRLEAGVPRAQVEGSAVAIGPIIYTFGGSAPGNLHRVLAYDTRSGHWSEPTQLPTGLNHSQAVAYEGDIYIAGGYLDGAEPTSSFWRYDPRADAWTRLPPMGAPRGAAAAAVVGHKLYVADGAPQTYFISDPQGPYRTLESFDFETGEWSHEADPPVAVHHAVATALDGVLYMAGGRTDPQRSSDEFSSYDPETGVWTRLPGLPGGAESSVGIVSTRGRVVIFGGDDELDWDDGEGSVSAATWAYDPETARWSRLPDLEIERHAHGAAVVGGRIYAVAGSYCPGIKPNGPVGTHTIESLPVSAVGSG